MSAKLDKIRLSLVRNDAKKLHYLFRDFDVPFSSCVELGVEHKDDIRRFHNFINPPLDINHATQKNTVPHYLTFIVDVLDRFILMYTVLTSKTSFTNTNEIHPTFKKHADMAAIIKPYFVQLSQHHPSLSTATFISYLNEHFGTTQLPTADIEKQLRIAAGGIATPNPVYSSLYEPFIYSPIEEQHIYLENHALVSAAVWNVFFHYPKKLPIETTIGRSIRKAATTLVLPHKYSLQGYENTAQLIEELRSQADFFDIRNYLSKLYKKASNPSSGANSSGGNKSTAERKRYRYIKVMPNELRHSFNNDDYSIYLIREVDPNTIGSDTKNDEPKDIARDELTGDEYIINNSSIEDITPEKQASNFSGSVSHIEKYNQLITDKLTHTELNKILASLAISLKNDGTTSSDFIRLEKTSAVCQFAIALCTGRSVTEPFQIQYLEEEHPTKVKMISISSDFRHLILPLKYSYAYATKENCGQNYLSDESVSLPIPITIKRIIKSAIKIWKGIHPALLLQNTGQFTAPYLNTNTPQLHSILKRAKLDKRVTPQFISNSIQGVFFDQSNGDYWVPAILAGHAKVIGATQLHYTTIINQHFHKSYQKAMETLFDEHVPLPDKIHPKKYKGLGNPIRPRKHIITRELNHMSSWISEKLSMPIRSHSKEDVISLLNTIMIFHETYTSYFNGIRDVTNPYMNLQQINENGFTTLMDKVIQNGYNTRLVCILDFFRDMQANFEEIVMRICRELSARKLIKLSDIYDSELKGEMGFRSLKEKPIKFPGYFLIVPEIIIEKGQRYKIKLTPYTRTRAKRHYVQSKLDGDPLFIQLAVNANRHFLRSALLERGTNPEYIDELMGHRHLGTESWNPNSLFNPVNYQKTIREDLYSLLKDFKVTSPFLKGSTT